MKFSTKKALLENDLGEALERVIAVVVQIGVEFGYKDFIEHDRKKQKN